LEPGVNNSEKPAFQQACTPDNLQRHSGWEYGHVLPGKLDVQVMFEAGALERGDSVNFESSTPHVSATLVTRSAS
jgi:hypothetical protein